MFKIYLDWTQLFLFSYITLTFHFPFYQHLTHFLLLKALNDVFRSIKAANKIQSLCCYPNSISKSFPNSWFLRNHSYYERPKMRSNEKLTFNECWCALEGWHFYRLKYKAKTQTVIYCLRKLEVWRSLFHQKKIYKYAIQQSNSIGS